MKLLNATLNDRLDAEAEKKRKADQQAVQMQTDIFYWAVPKAIENPVCFHPPYS